MYEPRIEEHLNCQDVDRMWTLLHLAVKYSFLPLFDFLMARQDLRLDLLDAEHRTPFLLAIHEELSDLALRLIERGCNVDTGDADGTTALMYACMGGAPVEVPLEILKKGVDVNQQDDELYTALHHACPELTLEILDLLLFYGADPSIRNDMNETVFMSLLRTDYREDGEDIVSCQFYLMDFEESMNEVNTLGGSTLFIAIQYETHSLVLEEIIKRGADVNYYFKDYSTLRLALKTEDADAFNQIWPKFDYAYVYSCVSRPLLCEFFHNLDRQDWFFCFHTVCESRFMEHAVQHYDTVADYGDLRPIVSGVIKAFSKRTYTEDEFFPYVCLVLSLGGTVSLEDLEAAYVYVGDNSLTLNFLLNVDTNIKLYETIYISHPYIMLNVTLHPDDVMDNFEFQLTHSRRLAKQLKFLPKLFQFCTPTDRFMDTLHAMYLISAFHTDSELALSLYGAYRSFWESLNANMCAIPSLLELSRNAARQFLCQKFHVTDYSEYYNVVTRIVQIPREVVDILLFKKAIYNIPFDIPYMNLVDYRLYKNLQFNGVDIMF